MVTVSARQIHNTLCQHFPDRHIEIQDILYFLPFVCPGFLHDLTVARCQSTKHQSSDEQLRKQSYRLRTGQQQGYSIKLLIVFSSIKMAGNLQRTGFLQK